MKDEPAFPQNDAAVNRINNHDGMTLRDYLAAKAMQGILTSWTPEFGMDRDGIAREAYLLADAMLAARTDEPGGGDE